MNEHCVLCNWEVDEGRGALMNHLRFVHQPEEWYPAVTAALTIAGMPGSGLYQHADPQERALQRADALATEWVTEAGSSPAETKVRILNRVAALRKAIKVGRKRD